MKGRRATPHRDSHEIVQAIYTAVRTHPGMTEYQLAAMLGMSRGALQSRLSSMDGHGLYLSEDDYGRLFTVAQEVNLGGTVQWQ
jgi:hypothetical protein